MTTVTVMTSFTTISCDVTSRYFRRSLALRVSLPRVIQHQRVRDQSRTPTVPVNSLGK